MSFTQRFEFRLLSACNAITESEHKRQRQRQCLCCSSSVISIFIMMFFIFTSCLILQSKLSPCLIVRNELLLACKMHKRELSRSLAVFWGSSDEWKWLKFMLFVFSGCWLICIERIRRFIAFQQGVGADDCEVDDVLVTRNRIVWKLQPWFCKLWEVLNGS